MASSFLLDSRSLSNLHIFYQRQWSRICVRGCSFSFGIAPSIMKLFTGHKIANNKAVVWSTSRYLLFTIIYSISYAFWKYGRVLRFLRLLPLWRASDTKHRKFSSNNRKPSPKRRKFASNHKKLLSNPGKFASKNGRFSSQFTTNTEVETKAEAVSALSRQLSTA